MKTYVEQGIRFKLKRTTPLNRRAVENYFKKSDETFLERLRIMTKAIEFGEEIDPGTVPEHVDDYKMYFDLFCLVTDGEHDKLDFDDFDVKTAETALADFLPSAARTALERTGFLPQSQRETHGIPSSTLT